MVTSKARTETVLPLFTLEMIVVCRYQGYVVTLLVSMIILVMYAHRFFLSVSKHPTY